MVVVIVFVVLMVVVVAAVVSIPRRLKKGLKDLSKIQRNMHEMNIEMHGGERSGGEI